MSQQQCTQQHACICHRTKQAQRPHSNKAVARQSARQLMSHCVLLQVRFLGMGGTSAGAINVGLIAAVRSDPAAVSWEETLKASPPAVFVHSRWCKGLILAMWGWRCVGTMVGITFQSSKPPGCCTEDNKPSAPSCLVDSCQHRIQIF